MTRRRRVGAAALCCFVFATTTAAAKEKDASPSDANALAITPLGKKAVPRKVLAWLQSSMQKAVAGSNIKVLPPARGAALKKQTLAARKCDIKDEAECLKSLAQKLDASLLLTVSAATKGGYALRLIRILPSENRILSDTLVRANPKAVNVVTSGLVAALIAPVVSPGADAPPQTELEGPPLPPLASLQQDGNAFDSSPDAEWEANEDDPVILHAQAIDAELDGDVQGALQLLRRAHQADSNDAMISFDLARVAWTNQRYANPSDYQGLLTTDSTDDAVMRLRNAINGTGAKEPAAFQNQPLTLTLTDASQLQKDSPRSLFVIAAIATQFDTNITVLPIDDPSRVSSARVQGGGTLMWRPVVSDSLVLDASLVAQGSRHLQNRAVTQLYDMFSSAGMLRATLKNQRLRASLRLTAGDIRTQGFARHFMQTAGLDVSGEYRASSFRLGFFGGARVRDFIDGNAERPAVLTPGDFSFRDDRDGMRYDAGLSVAYLPASALTLRTRLGFQREQAQGRQQREQGPTATVVAVWNPNDFSLAAGAYYEVRKYDTKRPEAAQKRQDDRLSPYLRVGYKLADELMLAASYTFYNNVSTDGFDYQRHVGQMGVEARW